MEKGEMPGLGRSEAQASSPPWALQTSCQPGPLRLSNPRAPNTGWLETLCCESWGGGASGLSDLLTERCTKTELVSTGKAVQELAGQLLPGRQSFPCLPLPVQTDHSTASELLKSSSSQPANTCSFIILEQARGCANSFKPGPITKPMTNSSVAWKLTRGPWTLQNYFYVVGVLGELPCPRLRAYAFLSQSPSMGTSW